MNEPIDNVLVIGCGYWGQNYVRNFYFLKNGAVVCCDTRENVLEELRQQYPSVDTLRDYTEGLKDPSVKAVVVAVPVSRHYAIVKQALEYGKHVLAEKPLALSVKDCEELIRLADKKKRTLMVAHTFLYNPAVRKMKEYMANGAVGDVYYLQATRTHMGLIREDVNVVWDLAPHDVSILNYLIGSMPTRVSAFCGSFLNKGKADVAYINLTYPGGVLGNIHVSWVNSNKIREVQVIGSMARMVFDDLDNLEKLKIFEKGIPVDKCCNFGEFQQLLRDGNIFSPKVESHEPLRIQCEHFLECIDNGQRPFTDGKNGLEIVEVMSGIEKSLAQVGATIELHA